MDVKRYTELWGALRKKKKIKMKHNKLKIELHYFEFERGSILRFVVKYKKTLLLESWRYFSGRLDLFKPKRVFFHNTILRMIKRDSYFRYYPFPELLNFKSDEHILMKKRDYDLPARYRTSFLYFYIDARKCEELEVLPRWIITKKLENIIINSQKVMKNYIGTNNLERYEEY